MQGASVAAVMVLTLFFKNILISEEYFDFSTRRFMKKIICTFHYLIGSWKMELH